MLDGEARNTNFIPLRQFTIFAQENGRHYNMKLFQYYVLCYLIHKL